jgi:hypothetical protein
MKKVVKLLVKTPKNLYGKKKKHVQWVMVVIKAFLHLSHHSNSHPTRKSRSQYQVCVSKVGNDDIGQYANAIHQ